MATFTSKATGNWSSGGQTTWNEVGVPGAGDTVTIAVGHVITVDTNTTIGSNASGVGHAITIAGTSSTVFGKLVVPSGVTLTLRGFDSSTNTMMRVNQYGRFEGQSGATIVADTGSAITIIDNRGLFNCTGVIFNRAQADKNFATDATGVNAVTFSSVSRGRYEPSQVYAYHFGPGVSEGGQTRRWISNAAGTDHGSFGDSSVSFSAVSPAGILATEVSTYEGVNAIGKYFIDYDLGVIYFFIPTGTSGSTFNYTVAYRYLTLTGGASIRSVQNTAYNEATFDSCTFNYWGPGLAVADDYVLNVDNKSCVALAADRRLFRCQNCVFNFCQRCIGLKRCRGTAADPIILDGMTVRAAHGKDYGFVLHIFRAINEYISWQNVRGTTYETVVSVTGGGTPPFAQSNWTIKNHVWKSRMFMDSAGTVINDFTWPGTVIENLFILGFGSAPDSRAINDYGGDSTSDAIIKDSVFWRVMRWINLASYLTLQGNVLGQTFHHGTMGSVSLQDIYMTNITVKNNIGAQLANGAFVELGYNKRQFIDNVTIDHNTVYRNEAGTTLDAAAINAAHTFTDVGDGIGSQLNSNVKYRSNLLYLNGQGVLRGVDGAGIMHRLGITEADHNDVNGSTRADYVNFNRFSTFTKGNGNYNVDPTRNCLGVTLYDPSFATAAFKTLDYTYNSADNITLKWAGGTVTSIVLGGAGGGVVGTGTATAGSNSPQTFSSIGGNGTLTDSGKTWSTAMNNALTPIGCWVKITAGTGSGQVRRITQCTTTVLTVAHAWTTTPDTTSTYVIYKSEVSLVDGSDVVTAHIDARLIPTSSKQDTGINMSVNSVSVNPNFVSPERDLATWDASLGGSGTHFGGYNRLAADPTLVTVFLSYLQAGFVPQALSLRSAAHDGTTIGAVQMLSVDGRFFQSGMFGF
jgi:hypothetical protein